MNLTYNIIDINDIDLVNFSEILETKDNIRKSVDESEFVIKYYTVPAFITNGTVNPLQTLSYEDCWQLMQTSEWLAIEE